MKDRKKKRVKGGYFMAKAIGIGLQDFEKIKLRQNFYIDKTDFIKEWWESGDDVTLITRPRRFGKTLKKLLVHSRDFSRELTSRICFSQDNRMCLPTQHFL